MEDKKIPMRVIIGTLLVLACIGVYCIVSDLFNRHGTEVNGIRDIERLGAEQQQAIEATERVGQRLEGSQRRVNDIEEAAGRAADRIDSSAERQQEIARIIGESQRRIEEYRRGLESIGEEEKPR